MKVPIAATAATAAALVAASMLGIASAEAPTTPPVRTVSVSGVAIVPVAQGASAAVATAAYRQAMAAAVADGQAKAEFLVGRAGATLAAVQSIAEGGGYISCTGAEGSGYTEYQGEQPDFGSPPFAVATAQAKTNAVGGAPVPVVHKPVTKRRKARKPVAKGATVNGCTLSTQVALVYAIS
jgi:hypothetical protein